MSLPIKIGIGYDIHPLIAGRPFVLGGILIEHNKGPLGHSDGDVLCHAIIDALLGACGLGDIGTLFPPDDTQYSGISSLILLDKVKVAVQEAGYRIINIDSLVICQYPKISPYYEQIRSCLVKVLELTANQVNIKAKTNEKLGVIGQERAIAAQAVALIELIS